MTDPIQPVDPAVQTNQQPVVDDILWWEDIFATIPTAQTDENEELPYGDILEKKYQFDPIPEEIPTPVAPQVSVVQPIPVPTPVAAPTPVEQVITQEEVVEEEVVPEEVIEEEIPEVETQSEPELDQIENVPATNLQTDVQKKFGELFSTTKKIYEIKETLWTTDETFDILWANNDKIFISYRFLIDETDDPILFITKIEQDKDTEEETTNELRFALNTEASSLEVTINDTLLFDEIQDFTEDQKKKMQVIDKLNKFIFLTSEELRKMEKEIKEREEAERERKKLQEIFRNF